MGIFLHLKTKFSALPGLKKALVATLFLVVLVTAGWAGYVFGVKKIPFLDQALSPRGKIIAGKVEEPRNFPNPIDGVLFKKSEADYWVNRLPLAVMIENHTDARPQTGLSKAEVVYEALAEGGITRFLAVFLQEDSELGPVRSARPYYLDWAVEYGAAYVHFGGSPDALDKISRFGIKDLNGLNLGAPTFLRSSARPAPHNVYTTTQKLRDLAQNQGLKKDSEIQQWKFLDKEPVKEKRPAVFRLKIPFIGTFGYDVEWRYTSATNSYLRFNASVASIDALTNTQIEAKTIVVQTVKDSLDPSGHARLQFETTGSGEAKVFLNGTVILGSWKKESRTSRTLFFDTNGEEIKLNRGKIWIDIIPPATTLAY